MKSPKFYTLVFVAVLLIACTKEYKSTEVGIEYELHDDVSPVKATLKVNNNLHYAEWIINDTIFYNVGGKNTIEHVFKNEGISDVEINASGLNDEKYFGNIQISIPPIASTLKIEGFYFDKSIISNLNDDSLKVELNYFNSKNYTNFSRIITKSMIENQDSITFKEPILIDIKGFDDILESYNYWVYFSIKGINEQNIYFKANFTLTETYFHDRIIISQDRIKVWNVLGENTEEVTIFADWLK